MEHRRRGATGELDPMGAGRRSHRPTRGFVLCTALLPWDELERWAGATALRHAADDPDPLAEALEADRATLRGRLRDLIEQPVIREAIFVASPVLEASIARWHAEPTSVFGGKVERGLVRYLARMAARPTPHALFAGTTVGTLGETTQLELAARAHYRRHSAIDPDYLANLVDRLVSEPAVRERLRFRPNPSLSPAGDQLRYSVRAPGRHAVVSVEPSPYLVATLDRARAGARPGPLVSGLCDDDPETTASEAAGFVDQLIDEQLLVPELAPALTGPEPLDDVIAQLAEISDLASIRDAVAALQAMRATLAGLDHQLGNPPARYRDAAATLPAAPDLQQLYRVDLIPAAARAELGHDVVADIADAVALLGRLGRPRFADELAQLRAAFVARYRGREVALADVLDEDIETALGAAAPRRLDPAPAWLAGRITGAAASGDCELVLDDADVTELARPDPALPDLLHAVVRLAITRDGERRLLVKVVGPAGAAQLARYGRGDRALHDEVTASIAAEQALRPEVVFAGVAHALDDPLADRGAQPMLRGHQLVSPGRAGAPQARKIALSDLAISVQDERIVLRSRSLDREVVPRMSTDEPPQADAPIADRLFAWLQAQGTVSPGLDLGPLAALPYVPRIRIGRVVLREASWTLDPAELATIRGASGAAQVRALARLRDARRLPRWLGLDDRGDVLAIDLDNALSIDTLLYLIAPRPSVTLTELWPPPDELVVRGRDGRYASELVVPFVRVLR